MCIRTQPVHVPPHPRLLDRGAQIMLLWRTPLFDEIPTNERGSRLKGDVRHFSDTVRSAGMLIRVQPSLPTAAVAIVCKIRTILVATLQHP